MSMDELRRTRQAAEGQDHNSFHPQVTRVAQDNDGDGFVTGGTTSTDAPTTATVFHDPRGAYYVDIDVIGAEPATGAFSVYLQNDLTLDPVLLIAGQVFDTTAQATFRVEVGGRKFHIKVDSVISAAAVKFYWSAL